MTVTGTLLCYLFFHLEVDACLEIDVCDQLCDLVNGSLACDCHEGYSVNPTTSECKARGEKQRVCVHLVNSL